MNLLLTPCLKSFEKENARVGEKEVNEGNRFPWEK